MVLSDGVDISIIGQIEEDEVFRKMKLDINGKKKNGKQNKSLLSNGATPSNNNNNHAAGKSETQTPKIKKEPKDIVKLISKNVEKEASDKSTNSRTRSRKISPASSESLGN